MSELKVGLVSLNMVKPSGNFTAHSKAVLLFKSFLLFMFHVCLVCSLQPCYHLLGKADLLTRLYVVFSCVLLHSQMMFSILD